MQFAEIRQRRNRVGIGVRAFGVFFQWTTPDTTYLMSISSGSVMAKIVTEPCYARWSLVIGHDIAARRAGTLAEREGIQPSALLPISG